MSRYSQHSQHRELDSAIQKDSNGKQKEQKTLKEILKNFYEDQYLSIVFFASISLGIFLAIILKAAKPKWTQRQLLVLQWPGELGGSLTKLFLIPLVMSSTIAAAGASPWSLNSRILLWAIPLFATLLYSGGWLGIILALVINPGGRSRQIQNSAVLSVETNETAGLIVDDMMDLPRNMFPANIVQATIQSYVTILTNESNTTMEIDVPTPYYKRSVNVGGIVVFCIAAGVTLERLGAFGRPIMSLCQSLAQVCTAICRWVVWFTPLQIVCDIAALILRYHSSEVIKTLYLHMVTLCLATLLYTWVLVPALYALITRTRSYPIGFIYKMLPAMLMAFGTSSSLITLPTTLWCLDQNRLNPRISRLVVLLGLSNNLSGAAIFRQVDTLFVVQYQKKAITFTKLLLQSFGTFSAGTVQVYNFAVYNGISASLLQLYGLTPSDAAYLIPTEWVADRITTVTNVICTSLIAGAMNYIFQHEISNLPPFNQILREGLLLKRLSLLAGEEPEPEPLEPEDDVEPEHHIHRHSVVSQGALLGADDDDARLSATTEQGSPRESLANEEEPRRGSLDEAAEKRRSDTGQEDLHSPSTNPDALSVTDKRMSADDMPKELPKGPVEMKVAFREPPSNLGDKAKPSKKLKNLGRKLNRKPQAVRSTNKPKGKASSAAPKKRK